MSSISSLSLLLLSFSSSSLFFSVHLLDGASVAAGCSGEDGADASPGKEPVRIEGLVYGGGLLRSRAVTVGSTVGVVRRVGWEA